ncbi:MAG: metal-dependent hydrolase [Acidobacteriota bacterium]
MDPVSHAAFGRTLIALDDRRILGPGAITACVIGSLAPDIDAVRMPMGWDVYLRQHQQGTHSLAGAAACAALTAAALQPFCRGSRYLPLLLAACAGAWGHLLLDVLSGADIRFFWPMGRTVALPLFAMADPWLGGLLVLGVLALLVGRAHAARAAGLVLTAVTILAAGKLALYERVRTTDGSSDAGVLARRAENVWGSLTRWTVFEATRESATSRRVDAVTRLSVPGLAVRRGLDDRLVLRSRQIPAVRNFEAAHDITFAIVLDAGADRPQVLWSDLRYCGPPPQLPRSAPWSPADLGTASPLSCALWFGGEFDREGAATASIVRVGQLVQRRSLR